MIAVLSREFALRITTRTLCLIHFIDLPSLVPPFEAPFQNEVSTKSLPRFYKRNLIDGHILFVLSYLFGGSEHSI